MSNEERSERVSRAQHAAEVPDELWLRQGFISSLVASSFIISELSYVACIMTTSARLPSGATREGYNVPLWLVVRRKCKKVELGSAPCIVKASRFIMMSLNPTPNIRRDLSAATTSPPDVVRVEFNLCFPPSANGAGRPTVLSIMTRRRHIFTSVRGAKMRQANQKVGTCHASQIKACLPGTQCSYVPRERFFVVLLPHLLHATLPSGSPDDSKSPRACGTRKRGCPLRAAQDKVDP